MPRLAKAGSTRGIVWRAGVLAALWLFTGAGAVAAQGFSRPAEADLRLEWAGSEDRRGRPLVSGYVYNQRAGSYAVSVQLLVEALDASGQVVGSTRGLVLGDVPPSNRSYFEIRAPAKAASYRVTIQSFSYRTYGTGGGM
ncbi:MAG TPA: hypothetical protein VIG07_05975 [Methylomirabilota bacterium]|jgi:hypothetical protein